MDFEGDSSYYWMRNNDDENKPNFDSDKGVHDLIYDVVKGCDESIQSHMADNLSG